MKVLYFLMLLCSAAFANQYETLGQYVEQQVVMITDLNFKMGGTGFYVKAPSQTVYLLTNNHVCDLNTDGRLLVKDENGVTSLATILKTYPNPDLCALLSTNGQGLSLADETRRFEYGIAVGHPHLGPLTPLKGRIVDHVFLAKVLPGNSGSPVTNYKGQVIGVIYARDIQFPIGYMVTLDEIKSFLGGL